jgi:hypothetical protein
MRDWWRTHGARRMPVAEVGKTCFAVEKLPCNKLLQLVSTQQASERMYSSDMSQRLGS